MDVAQLSRASCEPGSWREKAGEQEEACQFAGSASLCSAQTLAPTFSESCSQRTLTSGAHAPQYSGRDAAYDAGDAAYASSAEMRQQELAHLHPGAFLPACGVIEEAADDQQGPAYAACLEMIRHHKHSEAAVFEVTARLAAGEGGASDDGSRMIVVSWLVEVAEEFGLQQETLHSAVALLDRFLATSQGVPRCVLQLVAVGCTFLASKQLEVHHPNVEQMVAVAAHSFTSADLLRVERILLDALHFSIGSPTAYAFLHLLTQAILAAEVAALTDSSVAMNCSSRSGTPESAEQQPAAGGGGAPAMELVVSLAMYLTELALLDSSCLAFPGSHVATAALLLAHATLSKHCQAWPRVLAAAGLAEGQLAAALAALGRLHVAAAVPPSTQLAELLQPLKLKFGQDCWCRVAADVLPLALQGGSGDAEAAAEPMAMHE